MRICFLRLSTLTCLAALLAGCGNAGGTASVPATPSTPPVPTLPGQTPPTPAVPSAGSSTNPIAAAFDAATLAEKRRESMQRLRQIGLALHQHHDALGFLPPAYVADGSGQPLYSWRVLLLPYVGQAALYDRFDKTKAWDAPENLAISNTAVDVFKSPADSGVAASGVSYVAVVGEGTAFPGIKPKKLIEVQDGTSNTIALMECRGIAGSWAAPVDLQLASLQYEFGSAAGQINSPYPDGVQILLLDGGVRMLGKQFIPTALPKLLTTGGDEIVGDY